MSAQGAEEAVDALKNLASLAGEFDEMIRKSRFESSSVPLNRQTASSDPSSSTNLGQHTLNPSLVQPHGPGNPTLCRGRFFTPPTPAYIIQQPVSGILGKHDFRPGQAGGWRILCLK
jgi:hypothetical protein